jgi:hypothetical protein
VNGNVVGAVLNNVDLDRSHYKDYYYVGYYYYGEDKEKKGRRRRSGASKDGTLASPRPAEGGLTRTG